MSSQVRILGIIGSLRRSSYNLAALRAAKLVLKNAIDWASRPHEDSAKDGKRISLWVAASAMNLTGALTTAEFALAIKYRQSSGMRLVGS
jgi:NAD(P)H-dependent FMN reductase